jgi:putative addiction module component (TIGR02574 family)
MKKIKTIDIQVLSIPERIQLVEDIWDSIVKESDEVKLTEEEKKLIDKRLASYHQNPDEGATWEIVLKKIIKKNEI